MRVDDDGRGIPVGIHPKEGVPAVEVVLAKIHAGGKFDGKAYKVSGGLHGVGVSCVNALSEWLVCQVHQGGKIHEIAFARGKLSKPLEVVGTTDRTGTTVIFKADAQIFTTLEIQYELVQKRLRETAYLMGTRGLRIELLDQRGTSDPAGSLTFVHQQNKQHPLYIVHSSERSHRRTPGPYESSWRTAPIYVGWCTPS